ncbi:hypothetical protein VJ920_07925, partial [Adlercreutzia sp. R22]|nr:hypothetical protein [Adlercreutzia sp. R22]
MPMTSSVVWGSEPRLLCLGAPKYSAVVQKSSIRRSRARRASLYRALRLSAARDPPPFDAAGNKERTAVWA